MKIRFIKVYVCREIPSSRTAPREKQNWSKIRDGQVMERKVSPDFYKKTVKNSFEDYTGIDKSREEKKIGIPKLQTRWFHTRRNSEVFLGLNKSLLALA